MDIRILDSQEQWAQAAASMVADTLRSVSAPVFILPTGGTPVPMYQALARMYRQGEVSFRNATSYNLDEYVGLPSDHPQSYRRFMQENLFDHIDIEPSRAHLPDGLAPDPGAACRNYEQALVDAGNADLAVLGIGHNGHIGFNEPGSPVASPARMVRIDEMTRQANARFFDSIDEVPTHALTLGIASIMRSRNILLISRGADKADILYQALKGPVTTDVPASILQTHPSLCVVLDREAAGKL